MAVFLLALTAGAGPGLFWLWWFYHLDRYEPEPRRLVLRTALFGAVAGVVAALLELPFAGWGVFLAVVLAPVIEEYSKFTVVRRTVYNDPEFDESMDGLVYAAAAALGFASLENIFYVVSAYTKAGSSAAVSTFWFRALLSVPAHALFSAQWGAALGKAKFEPPELRAGIIRRGLLTAMIGHGLWNAICMIHGASGPVLAVLTLVLWSTTNRHARELLSRSPYRSGGPA